MKCARCKKDELDHDEVWTREMLSWEKHQRTVLHLICPRAFDALIEKHSFTEEPEEGNDAAKG